MEMSDGLVPMYLKDGNLYPVGTTKEGLDAFRVLAERAILIDNEIKLINNPKPVEIFFNKGFVK